MRFWITILTLILVVAALFNSTDLFESVSFNPMGNNMEPKTFSDDDTREREITIIENDNEPTWGTINYGKLKDLKTDLEDVNGVEGTQVGDATPMMDMRANATAKSKVPPLPGGLTVKTLPGVQPDGKKLNSFVFYPTDGKSLQAPRNYYLQTATIKAGATNSGVVSKGEVTREMAQTGSAKAVNSTIAIFQVPFGEEHLISDSTGINKKPSQQQEVAQKINKTLNELAKLAKDNASAGQLNKLLFSDKGGLSTDFNNINNMLNTGRYADAYKIGLSTAMGEKNGGLPGVYIKTDMNRQDVYAQFDFIYDSLKSGKGKGYFSPELVKWGKNNADSIIHLLMVNYMLQSQFQGSSGKYETPISLGFWDEKLLPYYKALNSKGRASKEPFYLYCGISPSAAKLSSKADSIPNIPTKYIQPDLAYIFSLYTNIMAQVWIGADGWQNSKMFPSQSQTWEDVVSAMNKKIKKDKVEGKNLSQHANNVSQKGSLFENNNLVSGLSTQKNGDAGTKDVYVNKEIVGSLRTLLAKGEEGSGKVKLAGDNYKITPIGKTKYDKYADSDLYNSFKGGGSDTYEKWKKMVHASSKGIPLQPAVFRSHWDSANSNKSAYIMMPTMLGGVRFPQSLGKLIEDQLKMKKDDRTLDSLSYANMYVMAFNFKPDYDQRTGNTTGVREVMAGKYMGTSLDKKNPIILTGYNGGETFSITEYFLAQDALNNTMDMPPNKAKTVDGKKVQLKYLSLFDGFFTIPTDKAFVGEKGGPVKYAQGFDFAKYKANYEANKSKQAISQISPNYSQFFEVGGAK
ncbi:hypothetical protein [Lysinibacillus xylanilyticus]|uniref:hypothetical protein n=1 Tax=Lysinibacillus xylanilyticus TaxID=582475 RepID=UPI0036DC7172